MEDRPGHLLLRPVEAEAARRWAAPEQGPWNLGVVDERSDLYRLGLVLYELFGGELPSRGGLAQAAAAVRPLCLDESLPGIPGPIVEIVARLLEVDPACRYQTARGLVVDLRWCRAQWARSGRLTSLPAAGRDVRRGPRMGTVIYGRKQVLARLQSVYQRLVADARPAVVCVTGEAGVGKSALLAEFGARVARSGGRVVVARFDAGECHVPYARLSHALTQLGLQFQGESPERQEAWRERLTTSLGSGADLLVDLAPALVPVLGQPRSVAHLSAGQAHARMCVALRRLVAEVATDGPLIIILDDLHHAHEMSLELLVGMMAGLETGPVLVIAAYQPAAAAETRALAATLDALGGRVTTVVVRPLPDVAVRDLLADALGTDEKTVMPLARAVAKATRSNPLAILHVLQALHERRALPSQAGSAAWRSGLEAVLGDLRAADLSALISYRIHAFPAPLRGLLGIAALLGDEFDVEVLAAAGKQVERVRRWLRRALGRHLLRSASPGTYRWAHEQVRLAALRLVPEQQVATLRIAVGRAMLANPRHSAYPFNAVEHLNAGRHLIIEPAEQVQLASLNLIAGRIAKRRGAAGPARHYFNAGLVMLPENAWSRCNDLAVALHIEAAEAEHVAGEQDNARQLLDAATSRAAVDLSQVDVLALHTNLPRLGGDWDPDAEPGLRALRLLGINAPEDPAHWRPAAAAALLALGHRLAATRLDALAALPAMVDRRALAAANLIATLLPSAQVRDQDWFTLLAAKGVMLVLDDGWAPASTLTFAFAALVLADHGNLEQATLCMDAALQLIDHAPASPYSVQAKAMMPHILPAWYRCGDFVTGLLHQAYQDAVEIGDLQQARANRILHHMYLFSAGAALDTVAEHINAAWQTLAAHGGNDPTAAMTNRTMDNLVSQLRGTKPQPVPETGEEAKLAELCRDGALGYASSVILTRILAATYILRDYATALDLAQTAQRIEPAGAGRFTVAERTFYHALTLTALHHDVSPAQQHSWTATLDELQAALDDWAAAGPRIFGWRALLVAAERARLAGHVDHAVGRYTRAIGTAREHGIVHGEAIAAELGGRYAIDRGQPNIAAAYLQRARTCYQQWGATTKVDQIDKLLNSLGPPTSTDLDHPLDLFAVLDTIQVIHSELDLDTLLTTALDALIHQAGAQRGALMLPNHHDAAPTTLLRQATTATEPTVQPPSALLSHVSQTRSTVAGSYQQALHLGADPYLTQYRPASLLCTPVIHRDELTAVLYLEHRYISDLFTTSARRLLHILCTHAGIAIHNATRYKHAIQNNQPPLTTNAGGSMSPPPATVQDPAKRPQPP